VCDTERSGKSNDTLSSLAPSDPGTHALMLGKHQLGRHPHTLDFSVAALPDEELSAPSMASTCHSYSISAFQTIVT